MKKETKPEIRLYHYKIEGEVYSTTPEGVIADVNRNVARFIKEFKDNPNGSFECNHEVAPDIIKKFLNEYAEE
jgi:hypothetical protein